MRRMVLFVLGLASSACSSSAKGRPQSGTMYSTVPCAENCGSDAQCRSQCVPAGNNPPPLGLMPLR